MRQPTRTSSRPTQRLLTSDLPTQRLQGPVKALVETISRKAISDGLIEFFLVEVVHELDEKIGTLPEIQELQCSILQLPKSASCPEMRDDGNVSQMRNAISQAARLVAHNDVNYLLLTGAAAAVRQWEFRESFQKIIRDSLRIAATEKDGVVFIIPYTAGDAQTRDAFIQLVSDVENHGGLANYPKASFFDWKLISFNGLPEKVSKDSSAISEEMARLVFSTVMRFTRERLDSKYQEALDNIDADKIRSIQSYLAEGIRFGGNKANGVKPWDLHKVAEESRKRILSALVREVAQPYNASCNVSPDNFIESEIRPYFDAFSLPNSCLGQAAPAVYGAKNRARQSTS